MVPRLLIIVLGQPTPNFGWDLSIEKNRDKKTCVFQSAWKKRDCTKKFSQHRLFFIFWQLLKLDVFMTGSHLIHNLFLTCSWLVFDLFLTCSHIVHKLIMTWSCLIHNLLIICSWLLPHLGPTLNLTWVLASPQLASWATKWYYFAVGTTNPPTEPPIHMVLTYLSILGA